MKKIALLVVLLLLVFGGVVLAKTPGYEFPIFSGSDDAYSPSVVFNRTTGEYLVIANKSGLVIGARFDSNGERVAPDVSITSAICCGRMFLSLAGTTSTGNSLVLFVDYGSNTGFDIWGIIVDGKGVPIGASFPISTAEGYQQHPSAIYDPISKSFFVLWLDNRPNGEGYYVQIVSEDGVLKGGEIPIFEKAGMYNYLPPAAGYDPKNRRVLVAFYNSGLLEGQILDSLTGSKIGNRIERIMYPSCCLNGGGGSVLFDQVMDSYIIAWSGWRDNGASSQKIIGRRISSEGTLIGDAFDISDSPSDFGSVVGAGGLCFWETGWSDAGGVFAGSCIGGENSVSADHSWRRGVPAIAMGNGGSFFLAWEDQRDDGSRIYGMITSGLPIRPTASLGLNGSEFSQGDPIKLTAKAVAPPTSPLGGGNWEADFILLVKTPEGAEVSLKREKISLPPGFKKEVTFIDTLLPQVPAGSYEFDLRLVGRNLESYYEKKLFFEVK